MTQNKREKKSEEKPRVPDELMVALRIEQAQYLGRGQKAPAFGELLLTAWRAYKEPSKPNNLSVNIPGADSANPTPQQRGITSTNVAKSDIPVNVPQELHFPVTDPSAGQLSELEEIAIQRLLRILRSPKPGLPDAIISNLAQFFDTAAFYDERRGDANPAAGHPAGQQGGTRTGDGGVAALERDTRESGKRAEAIADELSEIEQTGSDEHSEEAGHPEPVSEWSRLGLTADETELMQAALWIMRSPETTETLPLKRNLDSARKQLKNVKKPDPKATGKRQVDRRKRSGS